ncbi:hypothetical protein D7294_18325 [Streptomyces hoynatensis]|uniref:Uncharacterized protein n=1 Tax=Streptomyces hoynatensis TaxID=1141874 RepID=A0A3A9YYT7_9ACTN|nr:hypothetical protein D7294_18325 [Streptomyces hoynatensis]
MLGLAVLLAACGSGNRIEFGGEPGETGQGGAANAAEGESGDGGNAGAATGGSGPSPTSAPPSAASAEELGACYHNSCEVTVAEDTDIPLDGSCGIETLQVRQVAQDGVEFFSGDESNYVSATVGPGYDAYLNGLLVHVAAVHDGLVDIRLSPGG